MKTGILFFEDQQLVVDAPTRIGRADASYNYGGKRPHAMDVADVNNRIIIPHSSVSRNHAVIWPAVEDGEPTGEFYVQDLQSKNHTFLKKRGDSEWMRVPFHGPLPLENGDVVRVSNTELQFIIKKGRTLSRYALIVATDSEDRMNPIAINNANEMKKLLLEIGFKDNHIALLAGKAVSREWVWSAFKNIRKSLEEQSLFVFYYFGHGKSRGELCINEPGKRLFTPDSLTAEIAQLKGNKLIILECCYAGTFRVIGDLDNCAFLGSSRGHQASYYDPLEGRGDLNEAFVAALRASLSKNNNYVRIQNLRLKDYHTGYHVGDQDFTINGTVCFTAHFRDSKMKELKEKIKK